MSSTLRLFWEAAGGNVPEHWEFKTIDELIHQVNKIMGLKDKDYHKNTVPGKRETAP